MSRLVDDNARVFADKVPFLSCMRRRWLGGEGVGAGRSERGGAMARGEEGLRALGGGHRLRVVCTGSGCARTLVTLTLIEVRRHRAAAVTRAPALSAPVCTTATFAPRAGAAPSSETLLRRCGGNATPVLGGPLSGGGWGEAASGGWAGMGVAGATATLGERRGCE